MCDFSYYSAFQWACLMMRGRAGSHSLMVVMHASSNACCTTAHTKKFLYFNSLFFFFGMTPHLFLFWRLLLPCISLQLIFLRRRLNIYFLFVILDEASNTFLKVGGRLKGCACYIRCKHTFACFICCSMRCVYLHPICISSWSVSPVKQQQQQQQQQQQ